MPAILSRLHLEQRPCASTEGGADQRTLLAAENGPEPRARRRRSADDHRGLLPIAAAVDTTHRYGACRRARDRRKTPRSGRCVGLIHRNRAGIARRVWQWPPDRAGVSVAICDRMPVAVVD